MNEKPINKIADQRKEIYDSIVERVNNELFGKIDLNTVLDKTESVLEGKGDIGLSKEYVKKKVGKRLAKSNSGYNHNVFKDGTYSIRRNTEPEDFRKDDVSLEEALAREYKVPAFTNLPERYLDTLIDVEKSDINNPKQLIQGVVEERKDRYRSEADLHDVGSGVEDIIEIYSRDKRDRDLARTVLKEESADVSLDKESVEKARSYIDNKIGEIETEAAGDVIDLYTKAVNHPWGLHDEKTAERIVDSQLRKEKRKKHRDVSKIVGRKSAEDLLAQEDYSKHTLESFLSDRKEDDIQSKSSRWKKGPGVSQSKGFHPGTHGKDTTILKEKYPKLYLQVVSPRNELNW